MQLLTPRLVAMAVRMAAIVCKINFHISFFSIAFFNFSTLNFQLSIFNSQLSTFNFQFSIFNSHLSPLMPPSPWEGLGGGFLRHYGVGVAAGATA